MISKSMATVAPDALGELLPPMSEHEAIVEVNRCLYCYDAPCMRACPTQIDVPKFIRRIATGDLLGSAKTILDENLLGATCARVCPVQELCEGACVVDRPIAIGRLQRYAMDAAGDRAFASIGHVQSTGKRVAIIGAGPAGLSCAGELARLGHQSTIYEKRPLAGGLSTYGIIGLREPTEVALAEVEKIKGLGVEIVLNEEIGVTLLPAALKEKHEAIFIAAGLGGSPELSIPGEEFTINGLEFIEASKFAQSLEPAVELECNGGSSKGARVGKIVLVIGAGNTAIDSATVAKRLGAETVTIVYRRGESEMSAYAHEIEFIRKEGVGFKFHVQPHCVLSAGQQVIGLECLHAETQEEFMMQADQIVKAIGQEKTSIANVFGLELEDGWIKVSGDHETSVPNVFAGGDCIRAKGPASTVLAVQDGKMAARAIDRRLKEGQG